MREAFLACQGRPRKSLSCCRRDILSCSLGNWDKETPMLGTHLFHEKQLHGAR